MRSGSCVGYIVLFLLGNLASFVCGQQINCTEELDGEVFPAEGDCDMYYLCARGTMVLNKCPEGFSFLGTACVPSDLEASDCQTKRDAERVRKLKVKNQKPRCRPTESGLKAHPRKCSLYLDCDANEFSRFREESTKECEYPLLFDEATLSCRDGSEVDCGSRARPTDQCSYEANECLGGNCEPCELRMSSCAGRPDGPNALTTSKKNPVYSLCSNGSLVERKQCPFKDVGRRAHRTQMFNPETGECELTTIENKRKPDGSNISHKDVAKPKTGKKAEVLKKLLGTETAQVKQNPQDNGNPRAQVQSRDKPQLGNRRDILKAHKN